MINDMQYNIFSQQNTLRICRLNESVNKLFRGNKSINVHSVVGAVKCDKTYHTESMPHDMVYFDFLIFVNTTLKIKLKKKSKFE